MNENNERNQNKHRTARSWALINYVIVLYFNNGNVLDGK